MRDKALALAENIKFQAFIMVVIVLNAITLGVQTAQWPDGITSALMLFDDICLIIYIIEAAIKITAYGGKYFKDPWNIFDFVIILLCLVPANILPISPQIARIIRIFRAFKAFRLVSSFKHMRIIVEAIAKSLPGIAWTAVLMLIIYYVYAVIGTVAFADVFPDHFGDLLGSFYTLFQCMTMESWSEGVSRPVMEVYPWAALYFVSFVIISGFIMINVVVGIVVGTIDESQKELNAEIEAENNKTKPQGELALAAELAAVKEHLAEVERLLFEQQKNMDKAE